MEVIDKLPQHALLSFIFNGENIWWKMKDKKITLISYGNETLFDPFNFLKVFETLSYQKLNIPDDFIIPKEFIIFSRLFKKNKMFKQINFFNKIAQFSTIIKRGEIYVLLVNGSIYLDK